MLLLSETWISNKTAINLEINGFYREHVFGNKTPGAVKGRYSGGVSVYVKNYLKKQYKLLKRILLVFYGSKLILIYLFLEKMLFCAMSIYLQPSLEFSILWTITIGMR